MLTKNTFIKACSAAIFSSLALSNTALACEAQILQVVSKNRARENYDVFSDAPFALEKRFQANIKSACPVNLVISSVDKEPFIAKSASQKLNFNLYAKGAKTKTADLVLPPAEGETELFFAIRFPSRQYAAAGTMSKEMIARLWDASSETVLAERKFNLDVEIKPSSAVFFSGINQRKMNVDLGELTTGKKIAGLPQLRVISTSPYEVTVKSDNLGKIQHTSNSKASIDYELSVAKQILNLNENEPKWLSDEMTTYMGQSIPLALTIGNTNNKPAGTYKDTLRISIKPSLIL